FWFCFRFTRVLEARMSAWAAHTRGRVDDLLVPLLGRGLRVILPVLAIIFALPILGLPAAYAAIATKGSSILLIVAITVVLFQAVKTAQEMLLLRFDITASNNLRARKLYTQVHLLGRVAYVAIGLFAVACILMLFQQVRHVGTSLLASAGIMGIIAGVAGQKTLANLIAGFQIALAQPIRQDDVVIVEGEWGRIEEIPKLRSGAHLGRPPAGSAADLLRREAVPELDAQLGPTAGVGVRLGRLFVPSRGGPQGAQADHRGEPTVGPALLEPAGQRCDRENHAAAGAGHVEGFLEILGPALRDPREIHRLHSGASSPQSADRAGANACRR